MKLKYNHDGQTEEIQLYNEKPEGKSLAVRWQGANYYAALVEPDSSLASDIPIFYDEQLAVAKEQASQPEIYLGDFTLSSADELLSFAGDYALGHYDLLDVDGTTNRTVNICTRDGVKVGTITTTAGYVLWKYADGTTNHHYIYAVNRGCGNNGNPRASTAFALNSNYGDYGIQKKSDGTPDYNEDNANIAYQTGEWYVNCDIINAAFHNSTVIGNANSNNIYISGGDKNLVVGGLGNDSIEFFDGGGVICDYGIGADGDGKGMNYAKSVTQAQTDSYYSYDRFNPSSYCGVSFLQVHGTVTGVYFSKGNSVTTVEGETRKSNKCGTVNVMILYNSATANDNLILIPHINKKATTSNTNNATKRVWQTHDVAIGTLYLYHGSSGTSKLTGSNLSAVYHDFEDFPANLRNKATQLYQMYLNSGHVNQAIYDSGLFADKFPDWS